MCCEAPLRLCVYVVISAIAGILLKPQDFFFFSKILRVILNNSDILFGSDYKRDH